MLVRVYATFLLVVCLIFNFAAGAAQEKIDSPQQMKQLLRLSKDTPVMGMNDDSYKSFVTAGERNYSTFVLFTATHLKYKCGPCRQMSENFAKYGDSYKRHFGDLASSSEFLKKPFFLVQLEPDSAMPIFQLYEFNTVPHFVYIPPGKKPLTSLSADYFYKNSQASPEDIASFIQSKTGVAVEIYHSPVNFYITAVACVLLLLASFRMLYAIRTKLYDPMLWFVVTVGLYYIVMAGIAFNFIRGPPFADVNQQTGKPIYISPQARNQFVAEGFIIASLMTATGLLCIGIGDIIPRIRSTTKQRATFWVFCISLFLCLTLINDIFFTKYRLPAFRIHALGGFLGY